MGSTTPGRTPRDSCSFIWWRSVKAPKTPVGGCREPRSPSLDLDQQAMSWVIETYGSSRQLTFDRDLRTGEPTIELAHEAILSAWPRLGRWIDAAREDMRTERRLAAAARDWADADRDPSFLIAGSRLGQIEAWRGRSPLALTPEESEFLDAAAAERDRVQAEERARQEHERELERRSVRRLRTLVAVLTVAAVVAGALTVFATSQQRKAQDQERTAQAREARGGIGREPRGRRRAQHPARARGDRPNAVGRRHGPSRGRGGPPSRGDRFAHRAVRSRRRRRARLESDRSVRDRGSGGLRDRRYPRCRVRAERDRVPRPRRRRQRCPVLARRLDARDDRRRRSAEGLGSPRDLLWQSTGTGSVWGPSFDARGMVSAAWEDEGAVHVFDTSDGRLDSTIKLSAPPFMTALSPNGRAIAVSSRATVEVGVYDVASGRLTFELRGHRYPVKSACPGAPTGDGSPRRATILRLGSGMRATADRHSS